MASSDVQVDEMSKAVDVAEKNMQRFGLNPTEILSRRRWVASTRKQARSSCSSQPLRIGGHRFDMTLPDVPVRPDWSAKLPACCGRRASIQPGEKSVGIGIGGPGAGGGGGAKERTPKSFRHNKHSSA